LIATVCVAPRSACDHLVSDKWQTTAEDLIDTVISLLPAAPS
jgi:hypothetical protein